MHLASLCSLGSCYFRLPSPNSLCTFFFPLKHSQLLMAWEAKCPVSLQHTCHGIVHSVHPILLCRQVDPSLFPWIKCWHKELVGVLLHNNNTDYSEISVNLLPQYLWSEFSVARCASHMWTWSLSSSDSICGGSQRMPVVTCWVHSACCFQNFLLRYTDNFSRDLSVGRTHFFILGLVVVLSSSLKPLSVCNVECNISSGTSGHSSL